MKRLLVLMIVAVSFLLSGCTVAHFYYVRNLSDAPVELTFVFSSEASVNLRDSMYIPYSSTAHLVNKNTWSYMTDSIVAKKYLLKEMKVTLPSGSMLLLDRNTAKKINYYEPEKMKIVHTGSGTSEEVFFGDATGDVKKFKVKGSYSQIHWYDVY